MGQSLTRVCIIPEHSSALWALTGKWSCGTNVWQGTAQSGGLVQVSHQHLLSPAQVNEALAESKSCTWSWCSQGSPGLPRHYFGQSREYQQFSHAALNQSSISLRRGFLFVFRDWLSTTEFCNLKKKHGRSQLAMVTLFLPPLFPHRYAVLGFICLKAKFALKTQTSTLQILFVTLHSLGKETIFSKSLNNRPPHKMQI